MVTRYSAIILFPLLVSCWGSKNDQKVKLRVYANSSFISAYGPGESLKQIFETQKKNISIEYVKIKNSALLLKQLETASASKLDVVLGFDSFLVQEVNKDNWISLDGLVAREFFKKSIQDHVKIKFLPYDWSPLGFISRDIKNRQHNKLSELFIDLVKSKKISLPNPISSTPGMYLLFGLWAQDTENYIKTFSDVKSKNLIVLNSWSESYGLFRKGSVDATFSYLTSPAYHWVHDKDFSVEAYNSKIMPAQIEYVGVYSKSKNIELAKSFVKFLLSDKAQQVILEKNFMLPVGDSFKMKAPYDRIKLPHIYSLEKIESFNRVKKDVLKNWKKTQSH